jgi:CheY-like chemotaxis protein
MEDNDGDFETAVEAIERAGVYNQILRAVSGSDCLRLLREICASHGALPAFVLMDLNTPSTDGRDALSEMHMDDELHAVPVVVLSTSSNPKDVDYCYRKGARAYHIKPVNHAAHRAMLQTIFSYWMTSTVLPSERNLRTP